MVVHGRLEGTAGQRDVASGLDELSLGGASEVAEVDRGWLQLGTVTPEQAGLRRAPLDCLRGGDAQENAASLQIIFAGERGPRRDVVLLNAAAVLRTAGLAADLLEGAAMAAEAIDRGVVRELTGQLAAFRP